MKYSIKNGKNTRTVSSKSVGLESTAKQQVRADLAIEVGFGGYASEKPYLSTEKEEVNYYGGPNVKTNQAKVKYNQPYFGRPLVIKTPVLRMLEKRGFTKTGCHPVTSKTKHLTVKLTLMRTLKRNSIYSN